LPYIEHDMKTLLFVLSAALVQQNYSADNFATDKAKWQLDMLLVTRKLCINMLQFHQLQFMQIFLQVVRISSLNFT